MNFFFFKKKKLEKKTNFTQFNLNKHDYLDKYKSKFKLNSIFIY